MVNKRTKGRRTSKKLTKKQIAQMEAEAEEYDKKVIKPQKKKEQEKFEKEFEEVIESEDDLLKEFSPERFNIQVIYTSPLTKTPKLYKFTVKPIEPGDDLSLLDIDKDIYSDLRPEEKAIMEKLQRGETLTEDDFKIMQKAEAEARKKTADKVLDQTHTVLSQFVTPPDFGGDLEKRKEFWINADFMFKMFLFTEVVNRLGLNQQTLIKLFQGD